MYPVARGFGYDNGRDVLAGSRVDSRFGVASVGLEEAVPAKPVAVSTVTIEGVTPRDLRTLLRDAESGIFNLSGTVLDNKLAPFRKLVEALRIKE